MKQNQQIAESLARLNQLAEKAENANAFTAIECAKALGREQLTFNRLIAGAVCHNKN